jgi:hypothetical protein
MMSDKLNNGGVSDPQTTEHNDYFYSAQQRPEANKVENRSLAASRAAVPERHEETAFPWEAGARQLIDRLMAVALTVEGDIPEEARIHDLLKYCHLNDHADLLSKRPRKPIDTTLPATAEKTQRAQCPPPEDHTPARVNHPLNRVFVEWGPIALKKYRLAEVGTEFPVGVKKMADGHVKIMYHRSLTT